MRPNQKRERLTTGKLKRRKPVAELLRRLENFRALFPLCLAFTLLMIHNYVLPLGALLFSKGIDALDCGQMVWNLWFVNESVTHGHNPYLTNMLYFPVGANLSHHTLAAGFFPVTFLVKLFSGGSAMYPIYAYRVITLLSFTLILYTSYLLLRRTGFPPWASLIPAVAYAFSDFFMLHVIHLNHLAGFFIPLTALCVLRFYMKPDAKNAALASFVAAIAVYFTELAIYIYLATLCFVLLLLLFDDEREKVLALIRRLRTQQIVLASAVFIITVSPFIYLFLTDNVVKPNATDVSFYSANLAGFFIPNPTRTPLYGHLFAPLDARMIVGMRGYETFIGFPFLALGVLGIRKSGNRLLRICALASAIFFILSLGPTLKVFGTETGVPLPYALLSHVPPFDSGRTPVRFVVIALFFWMLPAAGGLVWIKEALSRAFGWRWGAVGVALIFVWVVAEAYSPAPRQQAFIPPKGLSKVVDGPVLNLPLTINDGYASLLQVFHHQPIATGFLARYSPAQLKQLGDLDRLIKSGGPQFCDGIRAMGIRNVIIAPDGTVPGERTMSAEELRQCPINVIDLREEGSEPNH